MQQQDKPKFLTLITDVMAFYKQDVSKFALEVWWEACKGFEFEQASKAMTMHATDAERGQFAPKPADVIRLLQGTKTDRSRLAWSKVMDAMQRVGAYQSVAFDDPIIHAVIEDLGGWMKLCRSDMSELSFSEHRFCESYRAYVGRPDMVYPAKLLGQHEIDNKQAGRKVAPPVLIGNPQQAEKVLRLGSNQPKTQFALASDVVPALQFEGKQA
ncbi:MAG: DUF6475 domain-containing protein [Acidobacteriota bacterium]